MMPAPPVILDLIARFERNIDAYKSGFYNETQVRREFIDPFFEAMGWDVNNTQGNAEAYKDVIHEDAVKVGGISKAPDYSFRIGGQRKFFIEAKKPSVNIKDTPAPAYQVRRYAWSAKLPLSIVTDFEEFAVYDCRIKPDQSDNAAKARIKYYTWRQYAEKFDEIAGIFGKDAILKGSFDKYAESNKAKRGTAEVDNAFLKEIESWRDMLAKNIALRNTVNVRELNDSVQRTIDRIIFLRIAEDRGIEEYGSLRGLGNGQNTYARLQELFYRADDRYNSGLFHFRHERGEAEPPDNLTMSLKIDDKPLKDILKRLYYPESPYEFSVLPADILGQVYEQFLGKVIRLTGDHRAVVEDKPEVKKAGGVFYTPTYIVDYIVKNTVGRLLEGKTPKKAESLRILDPACGSGSFLIFAFQYLLDWHLQWYAENNPDKHAQAKKPTLYKGAGDAWHLTTAERKRILLNNIYGVDIDSQAVEVTKLSLLLKVLEGETGESLNQQYKLFHERALPNLGGNIKCGNSLIGPDFYEGRQMSMLDDEERLRINVFDWWTEYPEIFDAGGFDAVIGNPPYGASFSAFEKTYLKKSFNISEGNYESYLLFVERAISLLNKGGKFGYIIPDTYLNLGFTQSLRAYLLQNTELREIVALPAKVFSAATVDTTLLFTEKEYESKTFHESEVLIRNFNKKSTINKISQPDREFRISTSIWHKQKSFNIHSDYVESEIIIKVENNCRFISDFAEMFSGIKVYEVGKGQPPQTITTRDTKPFTSENQKNDNFLPFFDGKHIGRYSLLWEKNNWLNYGKWLAAPRDSENFKGEKILIRKIIGNTLIATYIPETSYCNTLLHVLKVRSGMPCKYEFLLGILNSHFIGWYFKKKFQISADDTFPQIMIRDIMQFPIPRADKACHDKMVQLVEQMLTLNKQLPEAKTSHEQTLLQRQIDATDRQIDKLVYELYGLTPEEIAIVEGA